MSDVLWRRLQYFLSPQLDIYRNLSDKMYGKDVLEVGFGSGIGTIQLAHDANKVWAIESECDAVQFSEKVLPIHNVYWAQHDITTPVPFNRPFDVVVMIEVLEHIKEYRRALENIYNCLKPGGVLYMTARNNNADLRKNELHEREWKAGEFRSALLEFFPKVELYDYTLTQEQGDETRLTPLIGKATK
jgi:2-polyprenyl-3-methyl-5-hydroxy-6-metoxy-1,4-benzoquinol methylase